MNKAELDFDVFEFMKSMKKKSRKKYVRKIEEYEKIMIIDLQKFTQEQVRMHLCKKENFLYSKN